MRGCTPASLCAKKMTEKFPEYPARELARAVRKAMKNTVTLEQARNLVRYHLGLIGPDKRAKKIKGGNRITRPHRTPGGKEFVAMPKSIAEPWTTASIDVVGAVGILSDIHVPYHDNVALRAAVKHLKKAKIKGLLLNGDFADFFTISRWQKDPSKRDFGGELKQVRQLLEWLRQEFPKIPITAKLGNHEERLEHFLWEHAPELTNEPEMGIDNWLRLKSFGIDLVKDKRIVMVGKLPVAHGHELPRTASPVNAARGAFMRTFHTILIGHGHRTSGHADSDLWHNEVFCWSTGCLCDMTPDYARVGNKWNHGAAVVRVEGSGDFDVENFRITSTGEIRSS